VTALLTVAGQELRDAMRNRWVLAATLLLAALALSLALMGSAPTGTVKASRLAVTTVGLASLSVFLVPLIALLLAYEAIVGESERGTLALLLSYPVARWQVVLGKFVGHLAILALATVIGFGSAALAAGFGDPEPTPADWTAFAALIGSSVLLGAVFLALGYLISASVGQRATAGGIALALWLGFVLLYDTALLGLLIVDQAAHVSVGLFNLLLLGNPTDVYRLLNLTGAPELATLAGMAGIAATGALAPAVLLAALGAWTVLPLAAAVALFQRREA
jgi:Cu-processing system permease protein